MANLKILLASGSTVILDNVADDITADLLNETGSDLNFETSADRSPFLPGDVEPGVYALNARHIVLVQVVE